MNENLFLIGPMGAGKTTIGRHLAKMMNRRFYDSDREIESRTGVSVTLIFELENEVGFRKREQEMIDELTQKPDIVLATGGGAVLVEENRRHLHQRGHVIYLRANAEQLFKRTSRDEGTRPLLQTENPQETIRQLLLQREPLYREVAHTIIDTDDDTVRGILRKISATLNL